ncbi:MAG: hypothetical protein U0457_18360 [Candidatus Sericytochromatia bacterium]
MKKIILSFFVSSIIFSCNSVNTITDKVEFNTEEILAQNNNNIKSLSNEIVKLADLDKNENITKEEFSKAFKTGFFTTPAGEVSFENFDLNSDKKLSNQELETHLSKKEFTAPINKPIKNNFKSSDTSIINMSSSDLKKIVVGAQSYLDSKRIWSNISEMPPNMQFYFKNIGNKIKSNFKFHIQKEGLLFWKHDYIYLTTSDNLKIFYKKADSNENLEGKNVTAILNVNKISWQNIIANPFSVEGVE